MGDLRNQIYTEGLQHVNMYRKKFPQIEIYDGRKTGHSSTAGNQENIPFSRIKKIISGFKNMLPIQYQDLRTDAEKRKMRKIAKKKAQSKDWKTKNIVRKITEEQLKKVQERNKKLNTN